MNSLPFFFMNAWRWHLGMPEIDKEYTDANSYGTAPLDINDIADAKFRHKFTELMRNRMIMGYFRYGVVDTNKKYNFIKSAKRRIELYDETGNTEHLVDAANILRMEFDYPQHPNAHFYAQDDSEHSHDTT